jgi:AraC-like DNA-binding protein
MDKAKMHYQVYPVPEALRHYVRYFWSFDSRQSYAGDVTIQNFADRYPRLIFQDLDGFAPIRLANGDIMPITYLSGMDTCRTDAVMGASWSHFGVSFYPHALKRFFKADAYELTDQLPDIQQFDADDLTSALQEADTHIERVQVVSTFLYQQLQAYKKEDALVNYLLHQQVLERTTNIAAVQKEYHITERQLQRRFNSFVGVSPKKYQRMARFEKALQLLPHTAYGELTGLAYQLGYADQAHFINDFTAFAGISPYSFLQKEKVGAESSSFLVEG